jgi:hypothetical protein
MIRLAIKITSEDKLLYFKAVFNRHISIQTTNQIFCKLYELGASCMTDCNTACTLTIYLTSEIVKQKIEAINCKSSDEKSYANSINYPFLNKDGTNEKKIKSTSLHLQAL